MLVLWQLTIPPIFSSKKDGAIFLLYYGFNLPADLIHEPYRWSFPYKRTWGCTAVEDGLVDSWKVSVLKELSCLQTFVSDLLKCFAFSWHGLGFWHFAVGPPSFLVPRLHLWSWPRYDGSLLTISVLGMTVHIHILEALGRWLHSAVGVRLGAFSIWAVCLFSFSDFGPPVAIISWVGVGFSGLLRGITRRHLDAARLSLRLDLQLYLQTTTAPWLPLRKLIETVTDACEQIER